MKNACGSLNSLPENTRRWESSQGKAQMFKFISSKNTLGAAGAPGEALQSHRAGVQEEPPLTPAQWKSQQRAEAYPNKLLLFPLEHRGHLIRDGQNWKKNKSCLPVLTLLLLNVFISSPRGGVISTSPSLTPLNTPSVPFSSTHTWNHLISNPLSSHYHILPPPNFANGVEAPKRHLKSSDQHKLPQKVITKEFPVTLPLCVTPATLSCQVSRRMAGHYVFLQSITKLTSKE